MGASWKRTFYSAWVAQLLAMLGFSFVLPFLPFYVIHLGVTDEAEVSKWSGILTAGTGLAMAIMSPVWGVLSDRYGRKPMVLRSMIGGALVIGLMAFARNVHDLLFLRVMQGVLTGTIAASLALVASVTPRERSGYVLGMMQVAVLAGNAIGPKVGATMVRYFDFKGAFLVAGALLLAGGILVKFGTEEDFHPTSAANRDAVASYRRLFALAGFVIPLATIFLVQFANTAPGAIFPLFVRQLGEVDTIRATEITGNILTATGVAAAVAAFLFGRWSDRWGHRRMLLVCVTAAAVVAALQALVWNVDQLFVLRVLFGLAAAGLIPAANAIIHRSVPPDSIGKAFGATASVNALGFGLGPLVGGFMAAYTHQFFPAHAYRPPFLFCGVMLFAVAALVLWGLRGTAETDAVKEGQADKAAVDRAASSLIRSAQSPPDSE